MLRHDVPGLASSGIIVPQVFTHGVPRADGRARSSSSDPRSFKEKFELSQRQVEHLVAKAKENEKAWEHEHIDKMHLKSQCEELQSRLQSVSADLESKRALLQYQHEQHTAKER